MRITKRICVALLLAAIMVLNTIPVFAADETALAGATITAKAGDTVDVAFTLSGNPGVAMVQCNLSYDATAMTAEKATSGAVFGSFYQPPNMAKNPLQIIFLDAEENVNGDGVLFTVTFKIADNCPDGTYNVSFTKVVVSDYDENDVNVGSTDATITVTHDHNLTKTEAVPATCQTEGNIAYWTCSICGQKFSDAEGKTKVENVTLEIDPDGHVWDEGVIKEGDEPTAEKDGIKTFTCTLCGETKTEPVPFYCEHENLEHIQAKEATCSAAGNTEYWKCTKCNKLFSDAQAQNEITEAETVKEIVATAHVWGDWAVTTDPTCEDKGVETRTCTLDPTHTETRDVEALGHDWDEPTYTWDGNNVKAARVCKRDATHEETETVEAKEEVIAPTCEEGGKTVLKATFENPAFKEQTKDVEGSETEALGHDFGDPTFTWNYDNSATATFICKRDPSHKEVKAATVTSKAEGNEITYTAEVTFNGTTYTAKKTVQNQPQSSGYMYIPGANSSMFGPKKDVLPTREPDPIPGTKTAAVPAPVAEPAIPQVVNELPFIDVYVTDAYYDAVKFVYDNGLFKGVSDKEFDPSGTMTRAMFVTVLGRLAKVDVSAYTESSFTDVEPIGTWNYAPYVEWAAQNGIVLGYGDGRFGPNDLITKEQAAVIIARYAKYTGADTSSINTLAGYADGETVSDWAFDAVTWADDMNIYVLENGLLNPQAPASRAVVAMMLWAYVK